MNKKVGFLIGSILVVILGLFVITDTGSNIIEKVKGNDSETVKDSSEALDNSNKEIVADELEGLSVEEFSTEESANINGIVFTIVNVEVKEVAGDIDIPLNDVYVEVKVKNSSKEEVYIDSSVDFDLLSDNNELLAKIESNGYIKDFVKPGKELSGKVAFQVPAETVSAKLKVTGVNSEDKAGTFNLSIEK